MYYRIGRGVVSMPLLLVDGIREQTGLQHDRLDRGGATGRYCLVDARRTQWMSRFSAATFPSLPEVTVHPRPIHRADRAG
jgi:hypothetical protein